LDELAEHIASTTDREESESQSDVRVEQLTSALATLGLDPSTDEEPSPTVQDQVFRDSGQAIRQCALEDRTLRDRLLTILTPSRQACIKLNKIGRAITRTFQALDNYILRDNQSRLALDVVQCAERLRALVNETNELRTAGDEDDGPPDQDVGEHAMASFVLLLEGIVIRNQDAYAALPWMRSAPPNEPVEDRNLFANLIGSGLAAGELFVVDDLASISPEALEAHLDMLRKIEAQLAAQVQRGEAPEEYHAALRRTLMQKRKRSGAGGAAGRGGKRGRTMQ